MRGAILAGLLAAVAAPVAAHPHVFVEARVVPVFDAGGRLAALRIGWTYDELFSLMLVEDLGADADGDGAVSEAEQAGVRGFDMDWGSDFLGDTYVRQGDAEIALVTGPADWRTGWTDGRLWSEHTRTLAEPLEMDAGEVRILVYDPGYYVAYTIAAAGPAEGRDGCTTEVFVPDLDAAQEDLLASLKEYAPGDDLEDVVFPNVGERFAEEVRLTCGG